MGLLVTLSANKVRLVVISTMGRSDCDETPAIVTFERFPHCTIGDLNAPTIFKFPCRWHPSFKVYRRAVHPEWHKQLGTGYSERSRCICRIIRYSNPIVSQLVRVNQAHSHTLTIPSYLVKMQYHSLSSRLISKCRNGVNN
jgi:hypothetical protein